MEKKKKHFEIHGVTTGDFGGKFESETLDLIYKQTYGGEITGTRVFRV